MMKAPFTEEDDRVVIFSQQNTTEKDQSQLLKKMIMKEMMTILSLVAVTGCVVDEFLISLGAHFAFRIPYIIWSILPIIVYAVTIITYNLIERGYPRTKYNYALFDKISRRIISMLAVMYLCLIFKILTTYGKNIDSDSWFYFFAGLLIALIIVFNVLTKKGIQKSKLMILPIIVICIVESFWFNLAFVINTSYCEGVVVEKYAGARSHFNSMIIESENGSREYAVRALLFDDTEAGDTVILRTDTSIMGVRITEVEKHDEF